MPHSYHYLRSNTRRLWFSYSLVYVFLFLIALMYHKSLLPMTFWYWLICGTLFFLEYKGSYVLIENGKFVGRASFIRGPSISVEKIQALKMGVASWQIFQPEAIILFFENDAGKEEKRVLSLSIYKPEDVAKFVKELMAENPKITVDEEVKEWFSKKGTPLD